jgi:hypothetical protein
MHGWREMKKKKNFQDLINIDYAKILSKIEFTGIATKFHELEKS